MTYPARSVSSWKYPANAARIHARACRRVTAMAASCSRLRSRTMFAVSSSSIIVSTTARMKARLRFGGMERMNARPQIIMIVSSADGGGISSTVLRGNERDCIKLTPAHALPGEAATSRHNGDARNGCLWISAPVKDDKALTFAAVTSRRDGRPASLPVAAVSPGRVPHSAPGAPPFYHRSLP